MAIGTTLTLRFRGTEVKRGLASVTAGFKNVASFIGKLGVGTLAAGAALAVGLVAVAQKLNTIGEEGRATDDRLKNITKQMGLFGDKSGEVSDRLLDLADTQARSLGIDDDVIANTQSKLMTFKELAKTADVVGGSFDRATMAAVDMAKAGFGEAEQNAVQLGKALNDPVKGINALTRSGITFTAQEKEKIKTLVAANQSLKAQDMILKAIETQVGGTAQATARSSERIKSSIGQIVEEFAKPFSGGFDNLPNAFESVFPKLKEIAGRYGNLIANAVAESINGNFDKFWEIGSIIGDVVGAGIKSTLQAGFYMKAAQKIFEANMINLNVAGRLDKLTGNEPKPYQRSTQGQIDYEFRTFGSSETATKITLEKMLSELKGVNQKLAPQP